MNKGFRAKRRKQLQKNLLKMRQGKEEKKKRLESIETFLGDRVLHSATIIANYVPVSSPASVASKIVPQDNHLSTVADNLYCKEENGSDVLSDIISWKEEPLQPPNVGPASNESPEIKPQLTEPVESYPLLSEPINVQPASATVKLQKVPAEAVQIQQISTASPPA